MDEVEKTLVKKYKTWKEQEEEIRIKLLEALRKKSVIELLDPPTVIKLPKLELPREAEKIAWKWLWETGLPPLALEKETLENENPGIQVFVVYVPGLKRQIYQVILAFSADKLKLYCNCQRNAKANSWVSSLGLCSHKYRAYAWLNGSYREAFNSLDKETRERVLSFWEKKREEFLKRGFKLVFTNEIGLAVEVVKSILGSTYLKELFRSLNVVWDAYKRAKLELKQIRENENGE